MWSVVALAAAIIAATQVALYAIHSQNPHSLIHTTYHALV